MICSNILYILWTVLATCGYKHLFIIYLYVNISSLVCHCSITSLLHTDKLQSFSEDLPKRALYLYPHSAPCPTINRCPERAYTTMVSDIRVTCPNNDLAWRAAGTPIKQ